MELDKRIKDDHKIFTCFDVEQAKQYIDTKGYFTNDIEGYSHLDDCYYGSLNGVDNSSGYFLNKEFSRYFNFFLPEEFVKQKGVKKKYRPFTIGEFCEQGFEIVVMRNKETGAEHHVRYNGYKLYIGLYVVILGNLDYTLSILFDNYELLDSDNVWKPFGVEE